MTLSATTDSPWHAGELQMQRTVGAEERMADVGRRVLRDHLIDQHRAFYPLLSFVVLGAVDTAGDAWATLRAGAPGFLSSPDAYTLQLAVARETADPAEAGLGDGDAVGLLGIDLMTRRRNRLNGVVRRADSGAFTIAVAQAYGNCPKYIRQRDVQVARTTDESAPARARTPVSRAPETTTMTTLDDRSRAIIEAADTFFVASYVDRDDGRHLVDVSHRGGRAGFVDVSSDGVLTIPDFAGNQFFNTLGNLVVNPKAGLVFVDFATGELLQLSGDAEVLLDTPAVAAFQGAERFWRFTPRRIVHRPQALPLQGVSLPDGESPYALATGTWAEAAARLDAAAMPPSPSPR